MKKVSRILLPCLVLLISCGEEKPKIPSGRFADAAAYNDYIVGWLDSLMKRDSVFSRCFEEKISFRDLKNATTFFENYAHRVSDTLSGLEGWKGDTTLKSAAWKLVQTWSKIPAKYYPSLVPLLNIEDALDTLKYPDSIQPDDSLDAATVGIPKAELLYRKIEEEEQGAYTAFAAAQEKFAIRFRFSLPRKALLSH